MSAEKLSKITEDQSILVNTQGFLTTANLNILKSFVDFLKNLFGFFEEKEKNNRKVFVCKNCGYWEKI
jgi:hypothetical protein